MNIITVRTHEDNVLEFGIDHALGWWYRVTVPGQDVPLEEKSQLLDGLTKTKLADYLEANMSSLDAINYASCVTCIRMDMDPRMGLGWEGDQ